LATIREEYIRRLDVAMDDALRVRRIQGIRNLSRQVQQGRFANRPYLNPLLERLPLQQLHGDEGLAFVLIDVVYGADVGVIECRRGAGFPLEALEGLGVVLRRCPLTRPCGPPSPRGRGL
jgi:hypothetical protein